MRWSLLLAALVSAGSTLIVDLGFQVHQPSVPVELAVRVCVGLFNRNGTADEGAYVLASGRDVDWLVATGHARGPSIDIDAFLRLCLHGDGQSAPVARGFLQYDHTQQKIIVPNIVTLAAVLDAVPLELSQATALGLTSAPLLDIVSLFPIIQSNMSAVARQATSWVWDRYQTRTNGLAKMNPGLDVHGGHIVNPPLTRDAELGLVGFIVKERLFNFFLNLGCVPMTDDHAVMERIATTNSWPRPVAVYGYDDSIAIAGGDLFEAETDCVREHNMGQVASDGCNNLDFFSRSPRISAPLRQNVEPPSASLPYNSSLTYIALIVGDGDNLNIVRGSHFDWMNERVSRCKNDTASCFPLAWTISPAALQVAPDWLRWYYAQAGTTGADWFVLPPSGHLYSYPGEMGPTDQASFVRATEADAELLNASGTVSWEWTTTWPAAIGRFFPQYAARGVIKACFAVNVPYMLPVLAFASTEHYKILKDSTGAQVVLFAPREWRGNGTASIPFEGPEVKSPQVRRRVAEWLASKQ